MTTPTHFLVVAPPYSSRSGGIMVLHELCTALNQIGEQAGLLLITEGSQAAQNFKFGYSADAQFHDPNGMHHDYFTGRSLQEISDYTRNAVVIYPDIVQGNPLGASRYATYVLGFPKFEIDSEFVISYSSSYISNPDCILYKPFVSEHMHNRGTVHWSQRSLCLTYIGKGQEYADCHLVPNTLLVERDWPRDKQQLALLLRQCKYFYSWDCLSATNIDAVLCGAVPVLMQDKQLPRSVVDSLEMGALPPMTYEPGMDSRATPPHVSAIDQTMDNMVGKLNAYSASWLDQVGEFVQHIKRRP
ncbi:MAG: hypothetical protein AAB176_00785 [Pseudomonadota bacterium]|jgi:hypothetical protein